MPRTYRLGRRSAQKDRTRTRIVEAAIDLYIELGVSRTTMQQVARSADVAPGTLRNHFPSRDELDRAIVDRALADMQAPDLSIYGGLTTIGERLARLSRETGALLDRAGRWYRMCLREPMVTGVWTEAGAAYGARWDRLFREALGPLADDADAMAILRAMMHPTFFEAVGSGKHSTDETADLIAAALTPWLEAGDRDRRNAQ
jgi:AcrR family transcriptional regulator